MQNNVSKCDLSVHRERLSCQKVNKGLAKFIFANKCKHMHLIKFVLIVCIIIKINHNEPNFCAYYADIKIAPLVIGGIGKLVTQVVEPLN